jgi:hypothetical protein
LTPKPLDLRKDAMYPREMGVVTGAKGFISIKRMFMKAKFIGDGQVKSRSRGNKPVTVASG